MYTHQEVSQVFTPTQVYELPLCQSAELVSRCTGYKPNNVCITMGGVVCTHTACFKTQCERTKRTLSSPTQVTVEADSLSTKLITLLRSKAQFRAAERGMFEIPWIPRRSVSVTAGLTSVMLLLLSVVLFSTHTEAILPMR